MKNYLLNLILLASFANVAWGMDNNENQEIKPFDTNNELYEDSSIQNSNIRVNIPNNIEENNNDIKIVDDINIQDNKDVVKQNFSIVKTLQWGTDFLRNSVGLGFQFMKKQWDPVTYATSDENIAMVKFITTKFIAVKTIDDLLKLRNYVPEEGENQKAKGKLTKKVFDRNTALYNVILNTAAKKSNVNAKLGKKKLDTEIQHYFEIENTVYSPALESIKKAYSVLDIDNNVPSNIVENNENTKTNDKEDKEEN